VTPNVWWLVNAAEDLHADLCAWAREPDQMLDAVYRDSEARATWGRLGWNLAVAGALARARDDGFRDGYCYVPEDFGTNATVTWREYEDTGVT